MANVTRRNPPWVRDEIILALDLYLHRRQRLPDANDREVIKLSLLLNRLPLHATRPDLERFRSPNSVALKLANFAAIDPPYPGRGLIAGSKLDKLGWSELFLRVKDVRRLASSIRMAAESRGTDNPRAR